MINNVRERNPMPQQPVEVRCKNFDEVELGYTAATNKYRRGTPVEAVLRAADELLADVLPRLCNALWNSFASTVKGDARHHLSRAVD